MATIVSLLVINIAVAVYARRYDATCTNEGFLINGFCSCNSGFGTSDCSVQTDTNVCTYSTLDPLNTINPPAFNPAGSSFANNNIVLEIDARIADGRENFTIDFYGQTDVANCAFPGTNWAQLADGSCNDQFTSLIDWPTMRAGCGFTTAVDDVDGSGNPIKSYSNSLDIGYDETITSPLFGTVSRQVQNSLAMTVNFQTAITLTSSAFTVTGLHVDAIQFQAVLVKQVYNATTGLGELVYRTAAIWPYLITMPVITPPGTVVTSIVDSTNYALNCVEGTLGATNNPVCFQTWTVTVDPNPGVCTLSGLYHLDANATCQANVGTDPAMCIGAGALSFESTIQSSNFCPSLTFDAVLQGTLDAYTDATYTTVQTQAYANGGTAYFMADVSSPQATVENAWFVDVRIVQSGNSNGPLCTPNSDYSGCDNTNYGNANAFTADGQAASAGQTPQLNFGIQVVPAGTAYGQFAAPAYPMFSLAANSNTTFKIQTRIMVQYQGNRRKLVSHTFEMERQSGGTSKTRGISSTATAGVTSSEVTTTDGGDNNNNNGGGGQGSVVIMLGAAVGVVVLAGFFIVVVIRRRRSEEQQNSKLVV